MRRQGKFKSLKQWIQGKSMCLKHWIQTEVTLKRQWYLYGFSLVIFIAASIYFREYFLFQIGVTLFSIAIVYLVMKQSNIELKETTEKQINVFVTNLQMVCSELRNVCNRIDTLSGIMKDVLNNLGEASLASKEAIAKREREKRERKETIKPQLSVRLELRGWTFIFDLRRYHLIVTNSGNDAMGTVVRKGDWQSLSYDIGIYKSTDIDIGPISAFREISTLEVSIETRDADRNRYEGHIQVSLSQLGQDFPVSLIEV